MDRIRTFSRRLFIMIVQFSILGCVVASEENACRAIKIRFALKAGESYQKEIGGLTFRVRAESSQQPLNGWSFSLEDAAGRDFIAPVNPPLRFNPSQLLGPGYGLTASESMMQDRELRFLLNELDYGLVEPLWKDALWPYSSSDPDGAADKYLDALHGCSLGTFRLKIRNADVTPEDRILSADFEIEFIAPREFRFDPALLPHPGSCPPPRGF